MRGEVYPPMRPLLSSSYSWPSWLLAILIQGIEESKKQIMKGECFVNVLRSIGIPIKLIYIRNDRKLLNNLPCVQFFF